MIQSDHSHSGPDALGVWGGVPDEYLQLHRRADRRRDRRGVREHGAGPALLRDRAGRDLLSNQFDYDAANKVVDSDVRVLQARDADGKPFATLLNFSAHATVLGSSNTKVSGDWVQAANPLLEQRFGGRAMTVVGTLGRTQPADRGCADPTATTEDAQNLCKLDDYAGARGRPRRAGGRRNAQPIERRPVVARALVPGRRTRRPTR